MKRIISFAIIALLSSSLYAGTLQVNFDPAVAGGSPALASPPNLSGTVGDTGSLGIWAKPGAGTVLVGLGLDIVSSPAIDVTSFAWHDFGYFGGALDAWDVFVAGGADGNGWSNEGRAAVSSTGLNVAMTGTLPPPEYDAATGSFLVATIEYELVAPHFKTLLGSATPDREKFKADWEQGSRILF